MAKRKPRTDKPDAILPGKTVAAVADRISVPDAADYISAMLASLEQLASAKNLKKLRTRIANARQTAAQLRSLAVVMAAGIGA